MSNQSPNAANICKEDSKSVASHLHKSNSPTLSYAVMQDQQQQQQQQQTGAVPHPQQRVHVIKKNIYLMSGPISSNDNGISNAGTSDSLVIYRLYLCDNFTSHINSCCFSAIAKIFL